MKMGLCDPLKREVCGNGQNLSNTSSEPPEVTWMDGHVVAGFLVWHIMFFAGAGLFVIFILLCCCCRFRIPRTKQEIDADYRRKKLTRKFQRRLKMIQNTEMDALDLKKALDRIRQEFKSDTESHSEGISRLSFSSCPSPTYRKGSQLQIDFNFEEIMANAMRIGPGDRIRMFFADMFDKVRPKRKRKCSALNKIYFKQSRLP